MVCECIQVALVTLTTTHAIISVLQQLLVGQGLLINEASRSHSDTPHSVGLLWPGDQPEGETST